MEMQIAHPRRYLPADDPPDVDQLAAWMKQIAGAPWWHEVLKLELPLGSFKNWYSGSPLGKAKIAEVKARVDEWWARVMQACARAEFASLGQSLYNASKTRARPSADTADSYFFTLVVEDGLPVDEARKLYQDMMAAAFESHCSLIDLTDPKDPLEPIKSRFPGDTWGPTFDKMVADGYESASRYILDIADQNLRDRGGNRQRQRQYRQHQLFPRAGRDHRKPNPA